MGRRSRPVRDNEPLLTFVPLPTVFSTGTIAPIASAGTTNQRPASIAVPTFPPTTTAGTSSRITSTSPETTGTSASSSDGDRTPATPAPIPSSPSDPPPLPASTVIPAPTADADSTELLDPTTTETATSVIPVTSIISLSGTPQTTTVWLPSSASASQDPSGAQSGTTGVVEKIAVSVACVCALALSVLGCWLWKKRRSAKRGAVADAPTREQMHYTPPIVNGDMLNNQSVTSLASGGFTTSEAREKRPMAEEFAAPRASPRSSSTLSYINALCPEAVSLIPDTPPSAAPAPAPASPQSHTPRSQPIMSLRQSDAPSQHVRFRPLPVPVPRSSLSCAPEERGSVWSVMEVADARDTVHDAYGGIGGEGDMDLPPMYSRY
ncbi:hypothetical protein OH77DRAFT_1155446 [Trametes cingulata]|nr:hypothetical protein OH77DRAFT_1155446 [Trametes cingulata]